MRAGRPASTSSDCCDVTAQPELAMSNKNDVKMRISETPNSMIGRGLDRSFSETRIAQAFAVRKDIGGQWASQSLQP